MRTVCLLLGMLAFTQALHADFVRPKTTRRYLHGPLSERMAVCFREGKITLGENIHSDDWDAMRYWKSVQPAHGVWLVHGEGDAAFDFKKATLNRDPDGIPVHSQTWREGDLEVMLSACSPFGAKSAIQARLTLVNRGKALVSEKIGFLLRAADESKLVFGAPDIYNIYAPEVGDWKKLPSTFSPNADATERVPPGSVFHVNDRFVTFVDAAQWDATVGVARFPVELAPGAKRMIEFTLDKGKITKPGFASAEAAVRASWAKELARLNDRTPLVRNQVVQILQCFGRSTEGAIVLPRQGGLQRFVWPGETVCVAEALDRLGYCEYTEKALAFLFRFAKPDGQIGPFANNWAGETAYVLETLARHCLATGDAACWQRYREAALRGFAWIAARRVRADAAGAGVIAGLFPPLKSTDSEKVLQHWGMTDLVNEHALKIFAEAAERFGEPTAGAIKAEWKSYRGVIENVLERWRQASSGKDTFHIPIAPDGANEEKLCAAGFFYMHPGAFVEGDYLTKDEMLRLRARLLRDGYANEKGLYFHHPSSKPTLGTRIWYTTWCEYQWSIGWRRVGRGDLARQALEALLKWSVTDEGYVGERIREDDPWFYPWSPNASGSARILMMLLDEGLDKPCKFQADANWLPLDFRKTVVAGSAVDFSHFPFRDAPAGKHGWLKAKDGQFVFEKFPTKDQRFWGVNLCNAANCPSHEDADRIVTSLERAGYNAMRIHHYETMMVSGSVDRVTLNDEAIERFDYLFAKAKERGIYTTTDLYVSRPVHWRDVGIDREGRVPPAVIKGLFLVHEPAFENWKAFARNLLTHVNPYTGLRYADDPAMPFIVLVNEGAFAWVRGIFDLDVTRAAWKKWLAERRARDPKCFPTAPADCLGCTAKDDEVSRTNGLTVFTAELEIRFIERAREFLRSLGVKALVSDWNCNGYPDYPTMTQSLDYVDAHFYVDHPISLSTVGNAPRQFTNSNPDQAKRSVGVWMGNVAHRAKLPYTVSEWNFCAPSACHGAGGLLTGACAAQLGWDALWRFDFVGSGRALNEGDQHGLSSFAMIHDPFMLASDRAGVLLYLRRELKPLDFREDADYRFPVATETGTGRFTVLTDRTVGGYALEGDRLAAGPFACRLGLSPAVIWASAVDDKPLAFSDRILLTHLTDLKAQRMHFDDATCTLLRSWGNGELIVRRGTVEVSLFLSKPTDYDVWALETNGARKERLPKTVEGNWLTFVADVRNGEGKARLLYEIVRP